MQHVMMIENLRAAYSFSYLKRISHCFSFLSQENYSFIGTIIILTPLNSITNSIKCSRVFSYWSDIWPAKNIWFMTAFVIHLWDDNQALLSELLMIVKNNKLHYGFFPSLSLFLNLRQNEIAQHFVKKSLLTWKKVQVWCQSSQYTKKIVLNISNA